MRFLPSLSLAALLLCVFPFLASCSNNAAPGGALPIVSAPLSTQWVVGWGNSPENNNTSAENPGGSEQSFRFFFYPTTNGTMERVHLSNFFGSGPITVGAARLALASSAGGAAIDPNNDKPLTFGGSTSVTIAAGQTVVSDPVTIPYTYGGKMAVSMYLPGTFPPLSQHDSQVITNYASTVNAGNTTTDAAGTSFSKSNTEWYLLSSMDFYGSYQGTVVLFGSSTTDGHNSNTGNTNTYPTAQPVIATQDNDRPSDWLARSLLAAGYRAGVLNAGVLGDPAGDTEATVPGTGVTSGQDREQRDVIGKPGVKTVIVYLGSVDLRANECESAPFVETALTNIVAQANAVSYRVILATIPPASYCPTPTSPNFGPIPTTASPYNGDINPGPENPAAAQRHLLNTWIKTTGATLPGVVAIADYESAMAYPAHPDFLMPNLNSGDNTHPDGAGYGIQNSTIPISQIFASK